ncbi:hypothetical protein [Zooshikella sp. RANM57]|uniref:hypothetical protein n=1 Tax=Zooshikella sp. RANM57 TaxID=3425863 RepID=UPI003D6F2C99
MNKIMLFIFLITVLPGCMSTNMRVSPETYVTTANVNYPVRLTLTTGKIEYGTSSILMPAGGNIYVPVAGSGQPEWAYGRNDQEAFVQDLKVVLDNNSVFSSTAVDLDNSNKCCDSELNVNFVSTKQEGEVPIYYMDVIVTLETPDRRKQSRYVFESNRVSEVIHIFDNYLKAARHKANGKLMKMILADLNLWLEE